jgi:hypothetical protein
VSNSYLMNLRPDLVACVPELARLITAIAK